MLKYSVPVWVCSIGVGALFAASAGAQDAQAQARVRARMEAQISALAIEKDSRTPAQQKMASSLIYAERQRRVGRASEAAPRMQSRTKVKDDGTVLVDISADVSEDLLAAIGRVGGRVVDSSAEDRAIRAELLIGAIERISGREDVDFVRPAAECATNAGSVTSEGDVAHRANLTRNQFAATGAGVKVGVLSDSVDFLSDSQQLGDLPAITVLKKQEGNGAGEGTAMLEIVHDLAPDAQLFFATGFNGPNSMAKNIRNLAAAGCDVIIDDVTYFNESPFQDGTIARAVNDVSDMGVLYFSSARNSGNKNDGTASTWEGNFVNGGDDGRRGDLLDFGGGVTQNLCTGGSSQGRVDLFWADPLGKAKNDYDLYIVDFNGDIVDGSNDTQRGRQDPYEEVRVFNPGESIVVTKFRGEDRFIHVDAGRTQLAITTAGCVRGHNASGAANAFSVAATSAEARTTPFPGGGANPVESFSSDGPRRIFFDPKGKALTPGNFSATGGMVLQKPDITAADGNLTTLPPSTNLNPFFGTSSAAPHAGAIAALMLSANPSLTGAQVRSILISTAKDIEAPGIDRDSGAGVIDALSAVAAVIDNKPNLVPTRPVNWSAPVVVSTVSGTNTDASVILPTDTLRVDFAVGNKGTASAPGGFLVKTFVDDIERFSFTAGASLTANNLFAVTDQNIGTLPVGVHTVRVRIDTSSAVPEFNEGDNLFTKTIFVTSAAAPDVVKSTYSGIIGPFNGGAPELSRFGFFTMKVAAKNAFSAKLSLGTDKFRLKGKIEDDGSVEFKVGRQTGSTVQLTLKDGRQLSFVFSLAGLGAANQLAGTFFTETNDVHAILIGDRAAYSSRQNRPPDELLGKYTAILTTGSTSIPVSQVPQGFGIGAASVDKSGKARIVGKLADGVAFSQSAPLSETNTFPLHLLIGKKREILNGIVHFRDIVATSDFDASDLAWVKLTDRKAPAYTQGWDSGITANLIGSHYSRGRKDPALPFLPATDADGNARLSFVGTPAFPSTVTASLNIDERDKVKVVTSAIDGLKLKLKAKSGTFGGVFRNPDTNKRTKYSGVIFDKQETGAGFFISGDESGAVILNDD